MHHMDPATVIYVIAAVVAFFAVVVPRERPEGDCPHATENQPVCDDCFLDRRI